MPQPFAHLDDKRSDVLLFQHNWVVPGTVEELGCIVVDILDLNDDETTAVSARFATATPAIVGRSQLQPVRHTRLLKRADQRDDSRVRVDAEWSLDDSAT